MINTIKTKNLTLSFESLFLIKKRKLILFNPINSIYKIPSIIAVRLNLPDNRDFLRNKSDFFTFSPYHNYNGLFSKLSINLQMI
jgi:hypothetical protein